MQRSDISWVLFYNVKFSISEVPPNAATSAGGLYFAKEKNSRGIRSSHTIRVTWQGRSFRDFLPASSEGYKLNRSTFICKLQDLKKHCIEIMSLEHMAHRTVGHPKKDLMDLKKSQVDTCFPTVSCSVYRSSEVPISGDNAREEAVWKELPGKICPVQSVCFAFTDIVQLIGQPGKSICSQQDLQYSVKVVLRNWSGSAA